MYGLTNPFSGVPGDPMDEVLALQSYSVAATDPNCQNSNVSCPSNQSCLSNQSSAAPPPSDPTIIIIWYEE